MNDDDTAPTKSIIRPYIHKDHAWTFDHHD